MAMRILLCRVDSSPQREHLLQTRGRIAETLLHHFVVDAARIYGPKIAALKMHELLHIVDEYLRFGPLDAYSAFRIESFLGRLKKLVRSHKHSDIQVINEYSSLLHTGSFGLGGDRSIDSLEEFFGIPKLDSCTLVQLSKGATSSNVGNQTRNILLLTHVIRDYT